MVIQREHERLSVGSPRKAPNPLPLGKNRPRLVVMQRKKTDFDVLRFGRDEGQRLPVGGKRKSQDTLGAIRRRRGQSALFERVQGKETKRVRLLARISIGEGQMLAIRAPRQPEISIISKIEKLRLGSAGRGN